MLKWILLTIAVGFIGYVGYGLWDAHRAGLFSRPDMPAGAFSISYANGLRAILIDVPDNRETRRYFGFPTDVPFYIKDAWSTCRPPSAAEQAEAAALLAERNWPGERFEVVCKVDADGDVVVRGVITSVPKL